VEHVAGSRETARGWRAIPILLPIGLPIPHPAHTMHLPRTGRSHAFARQRGGLLHPDGELSFVELVALMDIEVARVLALGLTGGNRTQRRAASPARYSGGQGS
jgi:hypothetical protein